MVKKQRHSGVHYVHRIRYSVLERLVGLFVLATIVVLIGLLLATEKVREYFEEPFIIYGELSTAQGVGKDTVVRIAGIEAGSVSAMMGEGNEIIITMHISERFRGKLHADAKAELGGLSLLGNPSIDIHPGTRGEPLLQEEAILPVLGTESINELIFGIGPILTHVEDLTKELKNIVAVVNAERVDTTVENIRRFSLNLREISDHIRAGEGLIGAAVYDEGLRRNAENSMNALEKSLTATQQTMETAHKTLTVVKQRVAELEPVIANATELSESTKEAARSLPGLVSGLEQTVSQVNVTLSTLNTELQQFPDLVTRLKLLLDKATTTLDSLRRVWPLSSAVESSGGRSLIEAQPLND